MAHDRMTNDDLDRNMGRGGQEDDLSGGQDFGQKTPGRTQDDQQTGQKGAGQKKQGQGEEDEFGGGGQMGRTPQGGQNR